MSNYKFVDEKTIQCIDNLTKQVKTEIR